MLVSSCGVLICAVKFSICDVVFKHLLSSDVLILIMVTAEYGVQSLYLCHSDSLLIITLQH